MKAKPSKPRIIIGAALREDRRTRCPWCEELREPCEFDGLYDGKSGQNICAHCEAAL